MRDQDIQTGKPAPVIDVRGVRKSFKTVCAIDGIDLAIYKGQFVALLGPNGAGKTTLVEMIEGIQKPDAGEIRITGKNWRGNEDALHRIIGLSLQETRFIDKLTVIETLSLFSSFYGLDPQRIYDIIDITGLSEKQKAYVVNLSGGQRQRLALGIALLNNPEILLLDEPTTGLDPNARREIWSILLDLKRQSETSLILTTHYMEEAEQLCDRIVIIDKGRILKQGTLEQLLDEDHGEKIIEFAIDGNTAPGTRPFASPSRFDIQWNENHSKGTFAARDMERDIPAFFDFIRQQGVKLKNLECRRKTLDDLFTDMTGRRLHE